MVEHSLFHEFFKWVEITATLGAVSAGIFRYGKRVLDWILAPRRAILNLATNHLPHIQATLKQHTDTMVVMQSDLRDLNTKVSGYGERLDDAKKAVNSLHDAFIQHLENSSSVHGV